MVLCPDCGGVIGGGTNDGHKPCSCDAPHQSGGPVPGMPDPVAKPKVCCQCGKDLSGKKRFKDSLGYWCEACHYAEKEKEHANHTPCDSCGRYVETHKLIDYDGIRICSRCMKERKAEAKKMHRPLVLAHTHKEQEKKTIIGLVIAAGILLLIIVLSSMKMLPSFL